MPGGSAAAPAAARPLSTHADDNPGEKQCYYPAQARANTNPRENSAIHLIQARAPSLLKKRSMPGGSAAAAAAARPLSTYAEPHACVKYSAPSSACAGSNQRCRRSVNTGPFFMQPT